MPLFSFGCYEVIDNRIIEIVANEGAELDMPEAQECLTLYQQQGGPLGILVNRQHNYSASLEFVMAVGGASEVKAFAILVESELAAMVADSQKLFFSHPFECFYEKQLALDWLNKVLAADRDQ